MPKGWDGMNIRNALIVVGLIFFGAGILFKLLGLHVLDSKPISYVIIANTILLLSLIANKKK